MAKWVRNGPCPRCGSRDNLATYDDGSHWCWGCHYYQPPDGVSSHKRYIEGSKKDDEPTGHLPQYALPHDCCTEYPPEAVKWLNSYGIPVEEAIRNNIVWSRSSQQLIFKFIDPSTGTILLWQGRNFLPNTKRKYFTSGYPEEVIAGYGDGKPGVVVVEDCLSAIKISRQFASMPLFGSSISNKRLTRLRHLYQRIWFWLDSDKFREAQVLARRAAMLGMEAKVIFTELDPKCYTDSFILEKVK